ncbi:MAG: bifunctional pyr operon transcriptional regulator/uracil phosphoribosyltransferase PyrR [Bdellovibrionales bacterium]|nr:bifunctional pyr operon transcriptional regulator/uracil phosphoribosyltransferase PyrR [Bdellovibrionales bacterium]
MTDVAKEWKQVLAKDQIRRSVTRISHEILERNGGAKNIAIVGIRTRGEHLAKRIHEKIIAIESTEVPLGVVDITLYRDDLSNSSDQPLVRGTDLPFNVDKRVIVLVDDVLYTGRTVRSALDAIIDFGRPKAVQLAVLVDRGHRELPIRADYVGKSIPTAAHEMVQVLLTECDEDEGVYLRDTRKVQS